MLIKPADDRTKDIQVLDKLSLRPALPTSTRKLIEQEIENIRSGASGEKNAAYHINFYFEPSKNWAVIHDLRLEHGGRSAQIDHILINRLLEIYVCETKNFSQGIAWNERGEFTTFSGGRPQGIDSPVEQNRRHLSLLETLCKDGALDLPRRLGFALRPNFRSLILVSSKARVSPAKSGPKLDAEIIKVDQIRSFIEKDAEASTPLVLGKLIGTETLSAFANQLASRHQPKAFDWRARFGIPVEAPPKTIDPATNKSVCASCGAIVSAAVVKYCADRKTKFSGRLLCYNCQNVA